jgi:hypothetical protein
LAPIQANELGANAVEGIGQHRPRRVYDIGIRTLHFQEVDALLGSNRQVEKACVDGGRHAVSRGTVCGKILWRDILGGASLRSGFGYHTENYFA